MPYDKGKAEVFNRLYSQGTPKAEALRQAGIEPSSYGNYALGQNGQLGPLVVGTGKVAGVDYDKYTPEEKAEQDRFDAALKDTDYDEKPTRGVSRVTPMTYKTESTETVSGGGSTTIVAGPRQSTPQSTEIGRAYDAKNAEYNQFVKDNPSDFARRRQGLPPLTPEEQARREERLNQLNQEKADLRQAQINAETNGQPTVVTTPNTTTTTRTVTTGTSSTNSELNIQDDPAVFRQAETQLDATTTVASTGNSLDNPADVDPNVLRTPTGAVEGGVAAETGLAEPPDVDPAEDETLRTPAGAVEGGVAAETGLAEPPDFDLAEDDTLRTPDGAVEEPVLAETGLAEPPDVDAGQDEGLRTPDGEEEGGQAAETGLAEPTDADVAAAEAAAKQRAQEQATIQARYKQQGNTDWRVRLSLSPNSDYLYNAPSPGILAPLTATDGVIFPYTPSISTSYAANYEQYDLIHSNYRGVYYKNSRVSDISVRGLFTAQDTREANYLLAVIHFFRSVTKMFYGKDQERGTPPPLVFLNGFGDFQFSDHPCLVSNFTYTLPNDVDYIRATNPNNYGLNLLNRRAPIATSNGGNLAGLNRLANALFKNKSEPYRPDQGQVNGSVNNTVGSTYVPTKMEIDITLIPVQTRSQVSQQFSLKNFANGNLLKGGFW